MIIEHQQYLELLTKLQEQANLVGASVLAALLMGLPIGVLITRFPRVKNIVFAITSAVWTIPSLALLAFLIPILGIGVKPAIVVLTLYALLPIIRNTVTGIESVPTESIDAADGLGFTRWQRIHIIELPLAMPVIIAGLRTATTMAVGVATLAAFIGAGGLGDFINRGLATNNTQLILLGAIPAALMALLLDFFIALVEKKITERRARKHWTLRLMVIIFVGLIATTMVCTQFISGSNNQKTIRIATKNFTEQFILGELMAQMIEAHTDLNVKRQFNLGTTAIVHQAMMHNEIDLYPEYTGTAFLLVLKQQYQSMPSKQLYQVVKSSYEKQFNITWLQPFGFHNTQALAVKKSLAKKRRLQSISDLKSIASKLTIAASAEFVIRPDAMPGLKKQYLLNFKAIKSMDPGLVYGAINSNKVDVIMAYSTDGRIRAYKLQTLKDDKHFFPPYAAAPVIRMGVLMRYPEVKKALAPLLGQINNTTMQTLNHQVDLLKKSPYQVAHQFLKEKHLI